MFMSFQQDSPSRSPFRGPDPQGAGVCRLLETAVAAAFAVLLGDLRAPTRGSPRAAFARQTGLYLAHAVLGCNLSEVGALFGRDRATAAHAGRLVEERRDDPAIDAVVPSLEGLCVALARGLPAE